MAESELDAAAVPCFLPDVEMSVQEVTPQRGHGSLLEATESPLPSSEASSFGNNGKPKLASPPLVTPKKKIVSSMGSITPKQLFPKTASLMTPTPPARGSDKKPRCKRGEAGTFAGRRPPQCQPRRDHFIAIRKSWTEAKGNAKSLNVQVTQESYLFSMMRSLTELNLSFDDAMNKYLEELHWEQHEATKRDV